MRRVVSSLMAALVFSSSYTTALAVTPDGMSSISSNNSNGNTQVTMSVDGPDDIFLATIPAVIPISVDKSGNVIVPDNVVVKNGSTKSIKISKIAVESQSGWSIVEGEPSSVVGSKEYSIGFNGDNVKTDGSVVLDNNSGEIGVSGEHNLGLSAKVSPQSTVGNLGSIANINITLDWFKEEVVPEEPGTEEQPDPETQVVFRYKVMDNSVGKAELVGETYSVVEKSDILSGSFDLTLPTIQPKLGYAEADGGNSWLIPNPQGGGYYGATKGTVQALVSQDVTEIVAYAQVAKKDYGKIKFEFLADAGVKLYMATGDVGVSGATSSAENVDSATNKLTIIVPGSYSSLFIPNISRPGTLDVVAWHDANNNKLLFDYGEMEFKTTDWDIAREDDGGTTGVYQLKLITQEAEAKYSDVKFSSGLYGKIVSPSDNTTLLSDYETRLKWDGDKLSVQFPAIRSDLGKVFSGWVNTIDGSSVDDGLKPDESDNFSFTAVYEDQPTLIVTCNTDGNSELMGTNPITMKPGQSTSLPTVKYNSDQYVFDGWYYAAGPKAGSLIPRSSNGSLLIDYEDGGGLVNEVLNEVYITIIARCSKKASTAFINGYSGAESYEYINDEAYLKEIVKDGISIDVKDIVNSLMEEEKSRIVESSSVAVVSGVSIGL